MSDDDDDSDDEEGYALVRRVKVRATLTRSVLLVTGLLCIVCISRLQGRCRFCICCSRDVVSMFSDDA